MNFVDRRANEYSNLVLRLFAENYLPLRCSSKGTFCSVPLVCQGVQYFSTLNLRVFYQKTICSPKMEQNGLDSIAKHHGSSTLKLFRTLLVSPENCNRSCADPQCETLPITFTFLLIFPRERIGPQFYSSVLIKDEAKFARDQIMNIHHEHR